MNWNENQRKAIELRGKNMLVSAAAGSGKTAVLVERILRLIIEEKVNVSDILVVTFTKAAASEMKGKIQKAIKKRIVEDKENRLFLQKQLEDMSVASISTFHSFAMNIIKDYFFVIDINPNLKVADETQTTILKLKAIDKVFDDKFEEKDNDTFIEFLNRYSSYKSEKSVKENIMKLYEQIMAMPKPMQWLETEVEKTKEYDRYKETFAYKYFVEITKQIICKLVKLKRELIETLEGYNLVIMAQKQEKDYKFLKELSDKLSECNNEYDDEHNVESFKEVLKLLSEFKATSLRATKEEKNQYDMNKEFISVKKEKFGECLKRYKDTYLTSTIDEQFKNVAETYPMLKEAEDLIHRYHKEYMELKIERDCMDFSDIEHYAIRILEDENVALEYKNKYKYIFIDEYQDSNYIQEYIINRIKNKNNLFMVGDIKQSIYRFRLAEPDIFKEKYIKYARNESEFDEKIDLNQNFRSKAKIIDAVNVFFKEIMEGYDKEAALYLGVKNEPQYDFDVEVNIAEKESEIIVKEDGVDNKYLEKLSSTQLEALVTVKKIQELIGKEFYDHKADVVRKIEYKDIVILMRGIKSRGDIFREILEKNNIPIYVDNNVGYFETIEVDLLMNLLKVIDNSNMDIPLLSVLRSNIFNFTIEELVKIRLINKKTQYNIAFKEYADKGENEILKEKCNFVLKKLQKWKKDALYNKLDIFVWNLIQDSGIYSFAATMTGGTQRQLNLRAFVDKTSKYIKLRDNSIYGLLVYFEKIKKETDVGMTSLSAEEENNVQITTIHKSKGLEYPIVIVPGMSSILKTGQESSFITLHKNIGVAINAGEIGIDSERETILQKIIKDIKKKEDFDEELRILYVAMTRAKDKLILIGSEKDFNEYKVSAQIGAVQSNTFLGNLINVALDKANDINIIIHKTEELYNMLDTDNIKIEKKNIKSLLDTYDKEVLEEIRNIMEFEYPYQKELFVKSKFGVSEINQKSWDAKKNLIKSPVLEKKMGKMTGAKIGSIYHTIMEHIDFYKTFTEKENYLKERLKELKNKEIINEEELDIINIDKILRFFESDLGKRTYDKNPRKEQRFIMEYKVDDVNTIVQGVIDCFFEEDGEYVLIDYKTNFDIKNIGETYKKQLEIYKEAIELSTDKKVKEVWLYLFKEDRGLRIL